MKRSTKRMKGAVVSIATSPVTYLILAFFAVLFYALYSFAWPWIIDVQEDISYALVPSAEKAYEYGAFHFSAEDPADYDFPRAYDYFYEAAAKDPKLPFIWHQLARMSFIAGDYAKAMIQINTQISQEGDSVPSSYYVRGLIEGSEGDYADAEKDYAHFLELEPINWAGANDYAWVLLKDNKPQMADAAVQSVLPHFPNNAWLLNTDSIALYEMGDATTAKERLDQAAAAVATLTPQDWSRAYPGNDPDIASEGLAALKQAIQDNIQRVDAGQPI